MNKESIKSQFNFDSSGGSQHYPETPGAWRELRSLYPDRGLVKIKSTDGQDVYFVVRHPTDEDGSLQLQVVKRDDRGVFTLTETVLPVSTPHRFVMGDVIRVIDNQPRILGYNESLENIEQDETVA